MTHEVGRLGRKGVISPQFTLSQRLYGTPWFVLREALSAFQRHNGFGLSAALSFYAMFALIPMVLLIFFLLSHFAVSSHYALVKLALLVGNLVPKYSNRIMIEVYNIAKHKAVWSVFGMIALLAATMPLAGALRSAFFTIAHIPAQPSYLKRKLEDVLAVVGILALFFLFTFSGLMLEKALNAFSRLPWFSSLLNWTASLLVSALSIALFHRTFSPIATQWKYILIGAFVTALLWSAMRPAWGAFLMMSHSYGTIFGGMKNLFLSIAWLYYGFVVFLIGTEIIATLHKRDVLMLRSLFLGVPGEPDHSHDQLLASFGRVYRKNQVIFEEGDRGSDLFYVVSGHVVIRHGDTILRQLGPGDYFGEMAFLTGAPRTANAVVTSESAQIVVISATNLEMLMLEEPKVALGFLKEMAVRLKETNLRQAH
ncbi:MAG: YihY/virulence factor BrkB family protein [Methylophilaceae bacterium]|nr:YihY/virulence factor BrkB family protein [Methylophilaceae bacterium]